MKNYKIIGPSVYLEESKILIIGDLHIGFEKEIRRNFGNIYLGQEKENLRLLKKILEKVKKIKKIIFLGDATHSFLYKKNEVEEFKEIIDFLKENTRTEIILIRGNHDLFLKEEMFDKKIKIFDYFIEKDMLFIHGDKKSFRKIEKNILKKAKYIFLGHFHPAIEIKESIKKEKFKCFLIGKYKEKNYFFLPSFFPFNEGMDIRKNSEINQGLIKNLEVYVIDEEFNIYNFGKLKNLKF